MAAKCKTPGRKRAKRPAPREHRLDDDLLELASVIAEFQLDNNAFGWFRPAWRDGWNAAQLALGIWATERALTPGAGGTSEHERGVAAYLSAVLANRSKSAEAYYQTTDDISALSLAKTESSKPLVAAIRCYQVLVADSSGGGNVYNDVLKRAFEDRTEFSPMFTNLVLEWRCRDAIGTTSHMQGDANDRLRRAFTTAWQRSLYLAAYSLPPAINFSAKPTLVKE